MIFHTINRYAAYLMFVFAGKAFLPLERELVHGSWYAIDSECMASAVSIPRAINLPQPSVSPRRE